MAGIFNTFPLSNGHQDWRVFLLLCQQKTEVSTRPTTKIRGLLGSCFGAPKVSHEEAASAEVVSKRWPKVPFHGASAF
jgi:hypothetical protein